MNVCKSVKIAQKREFDVSDMDEHSNATVHGIVMEVSPIKVSKKILMLNTLAGRSLCSAVSIAVLSLPQNLQSLFSGFAQQSPHRLSPLVSLDYDELYQSLFSYVISLLSPL